MCIDDFQSTLHAIFQDPPRRDISWAAILKLLDAAEITYRDSGDRILIVVHTKTVPWRSVLFRNGRAYATRDIVEEIRYSLLLAGIEPGV
ncbi:MAG: hypothetical protein VKK04_11945 [Synechococcales bacterium]|nr:hypothetical protein [Synechococcales bacterium]